MIRVFIFTWVVYSIGYLVSSIGYGFFAGTLRMTRGGEGMSLFRHPERSEGSISSWILSPTRRGQNDERG